MDITKILPQDCISLVVSFTSPREACICSLVSHAFQSAANSDHVWGRFLPSDCLLLMCSNTDPSLHQILSSMSKKQLFSHIYRQPPLWNNGTMRFALDKESGKKQFMIGARGLSITWGDTPHNWGWHSLPESRFSEVAELVYVWWLEVKGKIDSKILSPRTTYAAYLVFKFGRDSSGFDRPIQARVNYKGIEGEQNRDVCLQPSAATSSHVASKRSDGWMEVEMGKFFNENGEDGSVIFCVHQLDGYIKCGLIVEGVEFRPENNGS